jgi:hypothetical protein
MGERVVEGCEGVLARDAERQRLVGRSLPDLDAGAVVGLAPLEADLEAAAVAVSEFSSPLGKPDDGPVVPRFGSVAGRAESGSPLPAGIWISPRS